LVEEGKVGLSDFIEDPDDEDADCTSMWSITLGRNLHEYLGISTIDRVLHGDIGSQACVDCLRVRGVPKQEEAVLSHRVLVAEGEVSTLFPEDKMICTDYDCVGWSVDK
jgi:hypothetical protein